MIPKLAVLIACSFVLGCGGHAKRQRMAQIKQDLGAALIAKQQYRQALSELLKAEALDPEAPHTQYHLGFVYLYGFNRPEQAEGHLRRAIALNDEPYSEAQNLLGVTLNRQGRREEAIKAFEEALTNILYPTPQFAQQNLAQTLIEMGRVEEGVRRLKHLVKQVPNLCGSYQSLVDVGLKEGDAALIKAYDPAFMKHCVRPKQIAERIDAARRRGAYRRAVARRLAVSDAAGAYELAQECAKRIPKTTGDQGPPCPTASKPKPAPGFGGGR